MKVLIVEEDKTLADILKMVIYQHDPKIEVVLCFNVQEALNTISKDINLVLLDYVLDEDGGVNKILEKCKDKKVVLISSWNKAEEWAKTHKIILIKKPMEIDDIIKLFL